MLYSDRKCIEIWLESWHLTLYLDMLVCSLLARSGIIPLVEIKEDIADGKQRTGQYQIFVEHGETVQQVSIILQ